MQCFTQSLIMNRTRAAIAILIHLLAGSAEPAGHQQPAAPPATMAGKWLVSEAVHHLSAATHKPLPWVGSGAGADATTSKHLAGLAWRRMSCGLHFLMAETGKGSDGTTSNTQQHGARLAWRRISCGLHLLMAEAAAPSPSTKRAAGVKLADTDSCNKNRLESHGVTAAVATIFHLLALVDSAELALTQAPAAPAIDDRHTAAMAGKRKLFEAVHRLSAASADDHDEYLHEALDTIHVLLRYVATPAPLTTRAAGVKLADTESCNIKKSLEPHAMKGGRKILADRVNGATTQTQVTKMGEKGSTKLKGAACKMGAA